MLLKLTNWSTDIHCVPKSGPPNRWR